MTSHAHPSTEVRRAKYERAIGTLNDIAGWIDTEEGDVFSFLTDPHERPAVDAPWRAAKYVLAHPNTKRDEGALHLSTPGLVQLHAAIVALIEQVDERLYNAWESVTHGTMDYSDPVHTSAELKLGDMAAFREHASGISRALDTIEREGAAS